MTREPISNEATEPGQVAGPTGRAPTAMPSGVATLLGFAAILLWSTLATLTALKGPAIPPFQTTAITFAFGGLLLLAIALARGRSAALRPPPAAFALAIYGLFAYHALYFAALRLAPPAEANLVASLWALLTVLFSGLLPGGRLGLHHVGGALMGLAAAAILVTGADAGSIASGGGRSLGLALALACAFVWASYSVLSRLVAATPSESLALPCLVTAALALACHGALEIWVTPSPRSWLALALLGVGPVGAAFMLWDIGMKQGRIAVLGVLAYASPVISTLMLVALGLAEPSPRLAVACGLMAAAAVVVLRRP